jgi:hypothetical protein
MRAAAGLRLDQQRGDAARGRPVVELHAQASAWNSKPHAGGQQQLVGGALVGRDVVAAHADAALQAVLRRRSVPPARRCARATRRPRRAPAAASARRAGRTGRRSWSPRRRCPCRRGSRSARPAVCARRPAPRLTAAASRPGRRRARPRRPRPAPRCGVRARRRRRRSLQLDAALADDAAQEFGLALHALRRPRRCCPAPASRRNSSCGPWRHH